MLLCLCVWLSLFHYILYIFYSFTRTNKFNQHEHTNDIVFKYRKRKLMWKTPRNSAIWKCLMGRKSNKIMGTLSLCQGILLQSKFYFSASKQRFWIFYIFFFKFSSVFTVNKSNKITTPLKRFFEYFLILIITSFECMEFLLNVLIGKFSHDITVNIKIITKKKFMNGIWQRMELKVVRIENWKLLLLSSHSVNMKGDQRFFFAFWSVFVFSLSFVSSPSFIADFFLWDYSRETTIKIA